MEKNKRIKLIGIIAVAVLLIIVLIICFGVKKDNNTENKVNENAEENVENKKVVISAETIANEPDKYYGKTVTGYITSKDTEGNNKWQIFNSDGKNIYLISKEYLLYNDIPKMPNDKEVGLETEGIKGIDLSGATMEYLGSDDITDENPVYNKLSYLKKFPKSENDNIKAVAYMVDQKVWKEYIGIKADYAIAGPTLEQLIDSYNSLNHKNNKKIYYRVASSNGYYIN